MKQMYKLNTASIKLFNSHNRDEITALRECIDAIRAILYLLTVMDISIDEKLYQKLDDSGKVFFKAE